jgi:hypothetical protein
MSGMPSRQLALAAGAWPWLESGRTRTRSGPASKPLQNTVPPSPGGGPCHCGCAVWQSEVRYRGNLNTAAAPASSPPGLWSFLQVSAPGGVTVTVVTRGARLPATGRPLARPRRGAVLMNRDLPGPADRALSAATGSASLSGALSESALGETQWHWHRDRHTGRQHHC